VLVEILTAALFLAVWLTHGLPLAPAYWLFVAILVTATFIDFEHFIIPDELTWGGVAAGVALSAALPGLMGTDSHGQALGLSLGGAALGYGLLWGIVEFGKLAFGKKKHTFPEPQSFSVLQEGETIVLTVGEEKLAWEEIFSWRASDELVIDAPAATLGDRTLTDTTLRFRMNTLVCEGAETPLDQVDGVRGTLRAVTIPREAMGFGDVKFIAAIGAFLGWQAVLFTVCAASIIGCVAALAGLFIARDKAGARVPFGPFLALGALIWVFGGARLWDWYFALLRPAGNGLGF
jgi:leader peptidase (prepilin peptidase)/N-methyltransferase